MRLKSVIALLGLVVAGCSSQVVRLEAENAQLKGVEAATTQPATPSGGKYVTGIDAQDDEIVFTTNLPPGRFEFTRSAGRLRLEWRPARRGLGSGSPVVREVSVP